MSDREGGKPKSEGVGPALRVPVACLIALLLSASVSGPVVSSPQDSGAAVRGTPTTVIIVRHSEKDTIGPDPRLSESGRQRAEHLSRMLLGTRVDALIASPRLRTQETLAPVAESKGIPVTVVSLEGGVNAHVGALLDTIRSSYTGRTVLVASHSNVIPLLLEGLGIAGDVVIGDDEYDDLFIVTGPFRTDTAPAMVRLLIVPD